MPESVSCTFNSWKIKTIFAVNSATLQCQVRGSLMLMRFLNATKRGMSCKKRCYNLHCEVQEYLTDFRSRFQGNESSFPIVYSIILIH